MTWHQPHRTPGPSSLSPAIPALETEKATGEKQSTPHWTHDHTSRSWLPRTQRASQSDSGLVKVTKGCEWLSLLPTIVTGSASSLVSQVLSQERSMG